MSDLISMREYAELHDLPLETVKTRVKHNQIPVFRFGKSVLIDKNTPWEERKKTGRKRNSEKVKVDSSIQVDKEELIKTLQGDREQFNHGYKAGFKDGYEQAVKDCIARLRGDTE